MPLDDPILHHLRKIDGRLDRIDRRSVIRTHGTTPNHALRLTEKRPRSRLLDANRAHPGNIVLVPLTIFHRPHLPPPSLFTTEIGAAR
jgi:hypothetical protein